MGSPRPVRFKPVIEHEPNVQVPLAQLVAIHQLCGVTTRLGTGSNPRETEDQSNLPQQVVPVRVGKTCESGSFNGLHVRCLSHSVDAVLLRI